jgi:hypothetical protein
MWAIITACSIGGACHGTEDVTDNIELSMTIKLLSQWDVL